MSSRELDRLQVMVRVSERRSTQRLEALLVIGLLVSCMQCMRWMTKYCTARCSDRPLDLRDLGRTAGLIKDAQHD